MSDQSSLSKPSTAKYVKKHFSSGPLKLGAREAAAKGNEEAKTWLHNKAVQGNRREKGPSEAPEQPKLQLNSGRGKRKNR